MRLLLSAVQVLRLSGAASYCLVRRLVEYLRLIPMGGGSGAQASRETIRLTDG